MPDDDGFVSVGTRKNRRGRRLYLERTADDYIADYERKKIKIECSPYFESFLQVLKTEGVEKGQYKAIRCLALGQPSGRGGIPLFQLALLGVLLDHLGLNFHVCSFWDPEFDKKDTEILEKMGATVEEEYHLDFSTTLVYMPHAPVSLLDKILGDAELAHRGCVIGNYAVMYHTSTVFNINVQYPSLANVVNQLMEQDGSERAWTATEILDTTKDADWANAFNDFAVHVRGDRTRH
jgi:hypothetical protein